MWEGFKGRVPGGKDKIRQGHATLVAVGLGGCECGLFMCDVLW